MLNDVVHKISDGLMGFGNSNGTGVHIKIGASAVQSLEPITITSSKKLDYIKNKLGLSPLTDAVMDSIEMVHPRLSVYRSYPEGMVQFLSLNRV